MFVFQTHRGRTTSKMKSERLAAENNSRVPSSLKMEFVYDELNRLRFSDPKRAQLLYFHISRAKNIMAKEIKKLRGAGIGIENAKSEKVEAIIDTLFVRFVYQSPS